MRRPVQGIVGCIKEEHDMAFTEVEQREFHTLYFLAFASGLAERSPLNTWENIGELVSRAEAYACEGRPGAARLESECKAIEKFIEKHQGHRQRPITVGEVNGLRDSIRDMARSARSRDARNAGRWLGLSGGTCEVLSRFGGSAAQLKNYLQYCRSSLAGIDGGLANQLEPIKQRAAQNPPNYQSILQMIEALAFQV
jgi:hypothetical protein